MLRIKGKCNEAIVYASQIENQAEDQILQLCDMEIYKESKIRVMPDVHAGAGCTIGTTMTLHGAVTPNVVGVDIGCGMETVMIGEKDIDMEKLDQFIKDNVPAGMNVRSAKHPNADNTGVYDLRCMNRIDHLEKGLKSIGTLGGGNHFIEVDRDDPGNLYIVIHSGSRHLGKEVADIYQRKAYEQLSGISRDDLRKVIDSLKSEGRESEIEKTIHLIKLEAKTDVPKQLAYVSGSLFDDYIHDMKIMQDFAMINRNTMMEIILEGMGLSAVERFTTVHNYIDIENMILRKGSVSAQKGEKLLIPINMRDGSLICVGKGNPDWNCSAPHGAGRIMSRSQAFRELSVDEFEKQMKGIYTTTANIKTLDESPMAYKNMEDIVSNIGPTADIISIIKPIYNFKSEQ